MEEKIIEAKFSKNKLALYLLIIGLALLLLGYTMALVKYGTGTEQVWGYRNAIAWPISELYSSVYDYAFSKICSIVCFRGFTFFAFLILLGILALLFALYFYFKMRKYALTVTNRRVTGKTSFGKYVDLPLNQISAVAVGFCRRITVATSSRQIHFLFIENREEVHTALTEIISKVQMENAYSQQDAPDAPADSAAPATPAAAPPIPVEELKICRELFDSGILTQEEFDAKKKQLLGL